MRKPGRGDYLIAAASRFSFVLQIPIYLIPNKMVSYESVNYYLDWLTYEKKAGFATKNNRLAAIRASISYASACRPEYISLADEFSSIRIQKKERFAKIDYMTEATVEAPLGQPDTKTKTGLATSF